MPPTDRFRSLHPTQTHASIPLFPMLPFVTRSRWRLDPPSAASHAPDDPFSSQHLPVPPAATSEMLLSFSRLKIPSQNSIPVLPSTPVDEKRKSRLTHSFDGSAAESIVGLGAIPISDDNYITALLQEDESVKVISHVIPIEESGSPNGGVQRS